MPRKVLPRIVSVRVGAKPLSLHVRWNTGPSKGSGEPAESEIDISSIIESFKVYASLRQSPELFQQVRVGEYGTDIVWTDEIDMSADTLWRLAQEQSGETMSAAEFRAWRSGSGLTIDAAARALGLSRRMVINYEQGTQPIPRIVMLATWGLPEEAKARSQRHVKDPVS